MEHKWTPSKGDEIAQNTGTHSGRDSHTSELALEGPVL